MPGRYSAIATDSASFRFRVDPGHQRCVQDPYRKCLTMFEIKTAGFALGEEGCRLSQRFTLRLS
jgi:hypothetical protein